MVGFDRQAENKLIRMQALVENSSIRLCDINYMLAELDKLEVPGFLIFEKDELINNLKR